MSTTVESLLSKPGLAALAKQLAETKQPTNLGESALPEIQELVRKELEVSPEFRSIGFATDPKDVGRYTVGTDTVSLGTINPDILAHELGHARNLRNSRMYAHLLSLADKASDVSVAAAKPLMTGIRGMVEDKRRRDEILSILSGVSAALAGPRLAEEFSASMDAARFSPDKVRAAKTLMPAFMRYTMSAMRPVAIYQAGKN